MEKLILVTLIGVFAALLQGCALVGEGEIYIGKRRIDEYQSSQKQTPQPIGCLFWNCNAKEAQGS